MARVWSENRTSARHAFRVGGGLCRRLPGTWSQTAVCVISSPVSGLASVTGSMVTL